jgi:hypothetical protein
MVLSLPRVREITVDDDKAEFRTVGHFLIGDEGRSLSSYFGSNPELVIPSPVAAECFCDRPSFEAVSFEEGSQVLSHNS